MIVDPDCMIYFDEFLKKKHPEMHILLEDIMRRANYNLERNTKKKLPGKYYKKIISETDLSDNITKPPTDVFVPTLVFSNEEKGNMESLLEEISSSNTILDDSLSIFPKTTKKIAANKKLHFVKTNLSKDFLEDLN